MERIKFNVPYLTGKETENMAKVMADGHFSGNGEFTVKCQEFCQNKWDLGRCFLTHSGTGALEMAALLLDIKPGDEVIIPSYTFPSTALAFYRQGAKIVFADSKSSHPCIDEAKIESLITPQTKAIVPVHYGGVACDMDEIMRIANKHGICVVEDAAQAIGAYYKNRALGSIGHMACFSFHESKNIHCGEGGMLVLNDKKFSERAEIIWEKGTNKAAFLKGNVSKYECVDIGSSFLASDLLASFLYSQLEHFDEFQRKRNHIWNSYYQAFMNQDTFQAPFIPEYAQHNSHIYYILAKDKSHRDRLISQFKSNKITAAFHYQSLHKSPFFRNQHDQTQELPNSDLYSDVLIRLPIHYHITDVEIERVTDILL